MSPTKGRKLGWHGFVDTYESVFASLGEMAGLGLLPEMVAKDSGVPL
jgi:hypothetical protein